VPGGEAIVDCRGGSLSIIDCTLGTFLAGLQVKIHVDTKGLFRFEGNFLTSDGDNVVFTGSCPDGGPSTWLLHWVVGWDSAARRCRVPRSRGRHRSQRRRQTNPDPWVMPVEPLTFEPSLRTITKDGPRMGAEGRTVHGPPGHHRRVYHRKRREPSR
jgi:hypothetical protein